MSRRIYTDDELELLVDHLDRCIAAATTAAMKYQDVEGSQGQIDFIKRNRKYWKAVASGLFWSKKMAIQMTRKDKNARQPIPETP